MWDERGEQMSLYEEIKINLSICFDALIRGQLRYSFFILHRLIWERLQKGKPREHGKLYMRIMGVQMGVEDWGRENETRL